MNPPTTFPVGDGTSTGPFGDGTLLPPQGAFTTVVRFAVEPGMTTALSMDGFNSAAAIDCVAGEGNDAAAATTRVRMGRVGTSAAEEIARRHGQLLVLPPADRVTCVMRVSNWHLAKTFGAEDLYVGEASAIADRLYALRTRAAVECGIFAIFGLYHLILFAMRTKERAPLWFGIMCLTVAVRIAVMDRFIERVMAGPLAVQIAGRLEILSLSVAIGILPAVFHEFLARGVDKRLLRGAFAVSAVLSLLVLTAPLPVVFGAVLRASQLGCLLVLVLGVYTTARDVIYVQDTNVRLFAAGFAVLFLGGFWDLAKARDIVVGPWLIGEALLLMVVMQSFVLARRNADARRAAETLARELDERNQELARANELKDEFLANTSHELRTPLTGIIGLAEALIDGSGGEPTVAQVRSLGLIAQSGRRLANLVNDLLDFSKMRATDIDLSLQSISVFFAAETVCALVQPLIQGRPLVLANHVADNSPCVLADEGRLQQILTNLVGNALKFTRKGEVKIEAKASGSFLVVSVHDTGVGIAPESRNEIFEAFHQGDGSAAREFGGTGLGLSVAKSLIEKQGGTISVESTVGVGSVFLFTLPLSGRPADMSLSGAIGSVSRSVAAPEFLEPAVLSAQLPSGSHRVLIVDDEPVNREVLVQQLSRSGHQIVEASNGQEALAIVAMSGKPDIVLLDVMMPTMSGYEVLDALRKTFTEQDLPVLLLTAKNREEDLIEGFKRGANDYIVKPFLKGEMASRIQHHLRLGDQSRDIKQLGVLLATELDERRQVEGALVEVSERAAIGRAAVEVIEAKRASLELALREAEERLVHAEKMATIGTMVAGVAHDLNNPLHFIATAQESLVEVLAAARAELDSEAKLGRLILTNWTTITESVSFMQTGLDRALAIGSAMRNMARADVDYTEVNIEDVANESLIICRHRVAGARVEKRYADAPMMWGRRSHLGQIVMNLVANAGDALNEAAAKGIAGFQPTLRISTRGRLVDDAVVTELTVEDNGPGIPEATRNRIFEPTFTTKAAGVGTGLGLAICAKIVADHGGTLVVDTSPELGGARFILTVRGPPDD